MTAEAFFARVVRALERAQIPYMVTGSFASSAHGQVRGTHRRRESPNLLTKFGVFMHEGELIVDKDARGLIGLVIGIFIGIPASYYLQSGMLRAKVSLGAYLTHLPELLSQAGGDVFPPLFLSCAVLGIVGWFVGRRAGETR